MIIARPNQPITYEDRYNDRLRQLLRIIKRFVRSLLISKLADIFSNIKLNSEVDTIEQIIDQLKVNTKSYIPVILLSFLGQLALDLIDFNLKQYRKVLHKLGVINDFVNLDTSIKEVAKVWLHRNLIAIEDSVDLFFEQISNLVIEAAQEFKLQTLLPKVSVSRSASSNTTLTKPKNKTAIIADLVNKVVTKVFRLEGRFKWIARDQIYSLFTDITAYRLIKAGYTTYTWCTCLDDAVRPSHAALEGMTCFFADSTIYMRPNENIVRSRATIKAVQLLPGKDNNCRCTIGIAKTSK